MSQEELRVVAQELVDPVPDEPVPDEPVPDEPVRDEPVPEVFEEPDEPKFNEPELVLPAAGGTVTEGLAETVEELEGLLDETVGNVELPSVEVVVALDT